MYLFLYYIHECFAFMYVCAPCVSWCKKQRVCQILELELWIIVSLQVSAGNWGQVLWNKQQMLLTMEPFLQSPPFFFFFSFLKDLLTEVDLCCLHVNGCGILHRCVGSIVSGHISHLLILFFFSFGDRALSIAGCPWTHREPPASATWVLGISVCYHTGPNDNFDKMN